MGLDGLGDSVLGFIPVVVFGGGMGSLENNNNNNNKSNGFL